MRERRGIIIHPEELDATWFERLQDARINVLGLHPVGGQNAHQTLEAAVQRHGLPFMRESIRKLNRMGIEVEYEAHAMAWLLPRALFDVVPNWFRMDENGNRIADFNMCASDEEALEYVSRRSAVLARLLDTGSDRYFYWLDDVTGRQCHCPKCQQLTAGDQQMMIANAILKGIRTYNPNAKLCYLAYHDAIDGPDRIEPLRGIFLEYAPIQRDSHIPLFDANCESNRKEVRSIRKLMDTFGAKDSQVLEYWVDNSRFSNWTKPPKQLILDEAVMRADVEAYRALGFESITSFGCYLGSDYRALWGEPPVKAYGDILRR